MKITPSTQSGKIAVTLSEQEFGAIATALKDAVTARRRSYEYQHHYGLTLTAMASLSSKFEAGKAPKQKSTSVRSSKSAKTPVPRRSQRPKAKGE